jgi:D-alanyl-D-alanine carboxypeptidase
MAAAPVAALAAPYAAIVTDARTGEVLYETNADTRLHPASLTKMMTLYVAFEAIERGEISLDTRVTISKHAAGQAPSKLGLKPGQKIALRYLIRAAAIKSANDAATAIGEAISGSEPAFAKRMTRTAKAIGMTRTTFRNANGLTAEGHLSTARDMTVLGRRLFYDFPQYYNIFSRRTADAGVAQVASTNRRFLDSYEGADGIKTGYTGAAGFNLTASAQRGNKRIIATIFGAKSTPSRNAKMAELLDIGFGKAPNRATVQKPEAPVYMAEAGTDDDVAAAVAADVAIIEGGSDRNVASGKTIRLQLAVARSLKPRARPDVTAPAIAASEALPDAALIADAGAPAAETPIGAGLALAAVAPQATPAAPVPGPAAGAVGAADTVADEVDPVMAAMSESIEAVLAEVHEEAAAPGFDQTTPPQPETLALAEAPAAAAPESAVATALAETAPGAGIEIASDLAAPDAAALGLGAPPAAAEAAGAAPVVTAALALTAPPARPGAMLAETLAETPADMPLATADAAGTAFAAATPPADVAAPAATEPAATEPITLAGTDETRIPAAPQVLRAPSGATAAAGAPEATVATVPMPAEIILAAADPLTEAAAPLEVVTRVSTSGGRQWAINVGHFGSRYDAERELLQVALIEMATLDEALRKVVNRKGGFEANFVGLTAEKAELACRRLTARNTDCTVIGPQG